MSVLPSCCNRIRRICRLRWHLHGRRIPRWNHRRLGSFSCACAANRPPLPTGHRNSCGRHNRRQTHCNPNRACFCRAAYRCTCSTSQQKSCERHTPLQNSRNSHTLPFGCAVYLNNCSRRHSSYCGRWHRWFRFSSVRRRTNSFCSHCWCKWRPAHFAIPMYGFRKRGKSSCRRYQGHALYIHKSPNSEHNGKIAIGNRLM